MVGPDGCKLVDISVKESDCHSLMSCYVLLSFFSPFILFLSLEFRKFLIVTTIS